MICTEPPAIHGNRFAVETRESFFLIKISETQKNQRAWKKKKKERKI